MCSPYPYPGMAAVMELSRIRPGQVIRVESPDAIKWLPEPPKPENCRNCGAPPDGGHACSYCGTPRG